MPNKSSSASASNGQKSPANAPTDTTALPLPQRMVLAAFAGMGAASCCHPLDVVRVHMQVEGDKYKHTFDTGMQIYRRAGLVRGLYAGISAAYLRQWLYGSFRIGIYAYLLENAQIKNVAEGRDKNDISFLKKMSMGCISGGIGSFVGNPSELALVRMTADNRLPPEKRRNYKNVLDCVSRVTREEGITNLWRGATPTVARATLLSACVLGVTSEVKSILIKSGIFGPNGEMFHGIPMMFCATLCSSFCANIVANPFDVVKSRVQNMTVGVDGAAMYSGMMDCFAKSIKADGIKVMWAGFTPAFVKLAPYTIISLTLVDKLTQAFTGKEAL